MISDEVNTDSETLKPTQESRDEAAIRMVEIATRFQPDESMAVMDLARARLAFQDAVSRRIRSECRE